MKPLSECRIVIVGMGLMGGSLAGALHGHCQTLLGIDRDPHALEVAMERRWVDSATLDLSAGVAEADIVILATPVRTIVRLVGQIGAWLPEGCVLLDLGSTKAAILEAMQQLPPHVQPLGGHPMCGKELAGIEAADPTLYRGRTFILSPLPRTTAATLTLGEALATAVGAVPLVIEGRRQDYLVAAISHLPYLLACALVNTADATVSKDPLVWKILAGSFRDTSRVAGSDVTMMLDILLTNRDEVLKALEAYSAQMQGLAHLVERADEAELRAALSLIREKRQEMYP